MYPYLEILNVSTLHKNNRNHFLSAKNVKLTTFTLSKEVEMPRRIFFGNGDFSWIFCQLAITSLVIR